MDRLYYKLDGEQTMVDSKGSMIVRVGKVSWNDNPSKLEIRKWQLKDEELIPNKGVTFLTEEGPNNLTNELVARGYGDTKTILESLKQREDYTESIESDDSDMLDKNDLLKSIRGES